MVYLSIGKISPVVSMLSIMGFVDQGCNNIDGNKAWETIHKSCRKRLYVHLSYGWKNIEATSKKADILNVLELRIQQNLYNIQ